MFKPMRDLVSSDEKILLRDLEGVAEAELVLPF
jgi:hypothetical protein